MAIVYGLPDTFTVGNMTYGVKFSDLRSENKHGDCGTGGIIRINHHDCAARQAKTLIHELLHAALFEHGHWSDVDHTEEEVRKFEPIIYDMLRNNNFAWLCRNKENELPFVQVPIKRSLWKRLKGVFRK